MKTYIPGLNGSTDVSTGGYVAGTRYTVSFANPNGWNAVKTHFDSVSKQVMFEPVSEDKNHDNVFEQYKYLAIWEHKNGDQIGLWGTVKGEYLLTISDSP